MNGRVLWYRRIDQLVWSGVSWVGRQVYLSARVLQN